MSQELRELILRLALSNAIAHSGKALPKPVLASLLALRPELRESARSIAGLVDSVVEEVNRMSLEEQRSLLARLGGEVKLEKKEKRREVKIEGNPVVRFAPNPDGALHLGSARPAILCDWLAKEYGGKFILRFDDTDPKVKVPEKVFYDWILEDLQWLGVRVDQVVYASKRLEIYYTHAERLVGLGYAYVCTCDAEEWRRLRNSGTPCPCRELSSEEQLRRWKRMLNHKYREGEAVLRIKTDLAYPNVSVRDWPAMRIVEDATRHPINKRAHLWPLYNFASAIDDHELGITHILRGQEHALNTVKQKYIYDYLGWNYPKVFNLGRLSLRGVVLSKSKTRKGISEGIYSGWDDPRLGTLRALRRRGFSPEAIRRLLLDIGITSRDSVVAFENLAAYNRKVIDPIANRYFFVEEPIEIRLDLDEIWVEAPLHPTLERGKRKLKVRGKVYVERRDFEQFAGREVRLKHFCNVILKERAEILSYEPKRGLPIIHWVPADDFVVVELVRPEGTRRGVGEINLVNEREDSVVQFERVGFARIEKKERGKIVAIFAHN